MNARASCLELRHPWRLVEEEANLSQEAMLRFTTTPRSQAMPY